MDVEKFGKIFVRSAATNEVTMAGHSRGIFLKPEGLLRQYYFQK